MLFEQHKELSWQLFLAVCALVLYFTVRINVFSWLIAFMLGSFIPDIDHPFSTPRKFAFPIVFLGKVTRFVMDLFVYTPLKWWFKETATRKDVKEVKDLRNTTVHSFRHRGILHNPLTAIVVFSLTLAITQDEIIGLFAAFGFLSHFVGDLLYSSFGVGVS